MRVHVIDVGRLEARVLERQPHDPLHSTGVGIGHVATVTRRGKAEDLRVDAGVAPACKLEILEDQRCGALGDDGAIAIRVEGSRRPLGLMVPGGGGKQDVEDRCVDAVEFLGASGAHDLLSAEADGLVGVADPLTTRCASAAGGYEAPHDAEELRDIRRAGVAHEADVVATPNAAGRASDVEETRIYLDPSRAALGASEGDPGTAVAQRGMLKQTRIRQCQLGGPGGH